MELSADPTPCTLLVSETFLWQVVGIKRQNPQTQRGLLPRVFLPNMEFILPSLRVVFIHVKSFITVQFYAYIIDCKRPTTYICTRCIDVTQS